MTLTREAPATEVVTPIRPSEALRLGRLTHPIGITGALYGSDGQACALGAIAAGWGIPYEEIDSDYKCFDERGLGARAACPDKDGTWCGGYSTATETVYHLNDEHGWSDDQIVAWLESQGL